MLAVSSFLASAWSVALTGLSTTVGRSLLTSILTLTMSASLACGPKVSVFPSHLVVFSVVCYSLLTVMLRYEVEGLQVLKSIIQIKKILREQSCGFVFGEPMVCCPEGEVSEIAVCDINGDLKSKDKSVESNKEKIKRLLYENGECGERIEIQTDADRIADGEDAPPGDWPWMALFSYGHRGGRELFDCGGSLISLNTVVTGAHCLDKK